MEPMDKLERELRRVVGETDASAEEIFRTLLMLADEYRFYTERACGFVEHVSFWPASVPRH